MGKNYWHTTWTCAHTGQKYQTHFFTQKEREKELERVFRNMGKMFAKIKWIEYKYDK